MESTLFVMELAFVLVGLAALWLYRSLRGMPAVEHRVERDCTCTREAGAIELCCGTSAC